MTGVPASCPHCGNVFLYKGLDLGGGMEVGLSGNIVECPNCHKPAHAIEGTFDFLDNAIRVKHAPVESVAIIERLQRSLRDARAGVDPKVIIDALGAQSPELAAEVSKIVQRGGVPALIMMLMLLLTTCVSHTNSSMNWNQIVDQVHVYITGSAQYSGLEQTTAQESKPEPQRGLSRQQRRQQERQSRKRQQRSAPQRPKAPKR